MQLRIPGPTPVPDVILKAVGKPMTDHRNKDFKDLIIRVTANLKELFQTKNDLLILTYKCNQDLLYYGRYRLGREN